MAARPDKPGDGGALALASAGIGGGVLPGWTPYAVFAGSAALAAAVLLLKSKPNSQSSWPTSAQTRLA